MACTAFSSNLYLARGGTVRCLTPPWSAKLARARGARRFLAQGLNEGRRFNNLSQARRSVCATVVAATGA